MQWQIFPLPFSSGFLLLDLCNWVSCQNLWLACQIQLWCFMVYFRSCSTHFRCGFRMMKHRWSGFNFQDFKHASLMQSLKPFQDSFVSLIWQVLGIYVSYQINIMIIQFLNSLGGLLASLLSVSWRVQFLCSAFLGFHFLQVLHPWHATNNESAAGHSSTQWQGGLWGSPLHICFLHSVILLYLTIPLQTHPLSVFHTIQAHLSSIPHTS